MPYNFNVESFKPVEQEITLYKDVSKTIKANLCSKLNAEKSKDRSKDIRSKIIGAEFINFFEIISNKNKELKDILLKHGTEEQVTAVLNAIAPALETQKNLLIVLINKVGAKDRLKKIKCEDLQAPFANYENIMNTFGTSLVKSLDKKNNTTTSSSSSSPSSSSSSSSPSGSSSKKTSSSSSSSASNKSDKPSGVAKDSGALLSEVNEDNEDEKPNISGVPNPDTPGFLEKNKNVLIALIVIAIIIVVLGEK